MEIGRLIGIKEFEGERENFVLNAFIDFKPVKIFEDRSSMSESGGPDNVTALQHATAARAHGARPHCRLMSSF